MADFPNGTASHILGPDGNPFELELKDPNSPAYAGGRTARELGVFAAPHVVTFASVMGSAYRTYSYRWDEAMRACHADALAMWRDTFLRGILQERKLASSQLNWHLEPEDAKDKRQKATAAFLEKVIRRMRGLPKLFNSLANAIWFGRYGAHLALAWLKMERPDEIPSLPGQNKVLTPCRFYPVNGDKIQYRYRFADDGPEIEDGTPVILGHNSFLANLPKAETVITDRGRGLLLRSSYWRERYIIHQHEPDDADFFSGEMAGGVHGVGVRSVIYWAWWLRTEWLSNVSDFIQKAGQGVIIVYYEAGNPESEAQAINVANNISNNTVIVWPRPIGSEKQGAGLDKMEMSMTGSETLLKLQQYMDGIIERYIIGQTASSRSETSGMGTHNTDLQADTKFRIIRFDANNQSDTLTHDLVAPLQRWNCPQETYQVRFVFDVDKPNAKEVLDAAKTVFDMGAPVKQEEVLSVAGLSVPQDDDKILKKPDGPGGAPGGPGDPAAPGGGAPAGGAPGGDGGAMAEHPMQPPMANPMQQGATMASGPMDASANDLDSLMQSLLGGGQQFAKHDEPIRYNLLAIADHFAKKRAPDGAQLFDGPGGGKYYVTKGGHKVYVEGGTKRSRAEVTAAVAKKRSPAAQEIMRRMVEHSRAADMTSEAKDLAAKVRSGEARYFDVVEFMAQVEDAGKTQAEDLARALGIDTTSKQDALKKLHAYLMNQQERQQAASRPAANFAPKIPVGLPTGKEEKPAPKAKVDWEKPWEHTLDEFLDLAAKSEGEIVQEHRRMIERALENGKPVPAEVLKDYPDLVKKPGESAPPEPVSTEPRTFAGGHDWSPSEKARMERKERIRKLTALLNLAKYRSSSAGPSQQDYEDIAEHMVEMSPTEIREVAEHLGLPPPKDFDSIRQIADRIIHEVKHKRDVMGMHGGVRKFDADDAMIVEMAQAMAPLVASIFRAA